MFSSYTGFCFAHHPYQPEQQQTDAHAQHIQAIGTNRRRRNIFNQAVISGKKDICQQNSDMCFGVAVQGNNLSGKDRQAAITFLKGKK